MSPLEDFLVIDITQNVAGPFCTQILADLGADVIKVEPLGDGDSTRQWGPPFWNDESAIFLAFNRNKRSIALDLKSEYGRQILRRLLTKADVFVHALRPEAALRLGVDAESVRAQHDDIIISELSAFGRRGPLRNDPGYDPLLQAFTGLMSVTGQPAGSPVRLGTSIVDMGAGMWSALGIVAALLSRSRGRPVVNVETSLFETAMAWLPYQIAGFLATGQAPGRWGTELQMLMPYGAYQASDQCVVIAAGSDAIWKRLCHAVDAPRLIEDERFKTNPARVENRTELREVLESILAADTATHWASTLRSHGVPSSLINDVPAAVAHAQTDAAGILQPIDHPLNPDLRLVRLPLRFDGMLAQEPHRPPALGEHTREVLSDLAFTVEEINDLVARGIVGLDEGTCDDAERGNIS